MGGGRNAPVHPELSGKMFVLWRLMREMRKPGNGGDKIVIVSNYTQTLDLIGRMCRENNWGFCRLDGSISMKKRQAMVSAMYFLEAPRDVISRYLTDVSHLHPSVRRIQ
jgi:DNA repair and recombination RAD54-like protein